MICISKKKEKTIKIIFFRIKSVIPPKFESLCLRVVKHKQNKLKTETQTEQT